MARGPAGKKGGGGAEMEKGGAARKSRGLPIGKAMIVRDMELADSDEGDDIQPDAFKSKKDRVSLQVSDGGADTDEDDYHEVMGLEGVEDSEDDGEDDDEELDEEDLIEEAIQRGGRMGQMAQAAKTLGRKVKLHAPEEEGAEEETDGAKAYKKKGPQEGEEGAGWGATRGEYYGDDSEEPEDDEELAMLEAEVTRQQRQRAARTRASDYGVEGEDEEGEDEDDLSLDEDEEDKDEESDEEDTMEAAAKRAAKTTVSQRQMGQVVEVVPRELDALSAEERTAALMADAPELGALLDELTTALNEVRHRLGPLLAEVRAGKLATREGLSYLEAKHLLLLHYAAHIVFYCMLKAEGRSVRDHPVILRLVEIRSYLDKIRPIDKQLAYQIDKLLRATVAAKARDAREAGATAGVQGNGQAASAPGEEVDEDDELAAAPRPDLLVSRAQATRRGASEGSGLGRPGEGGDGIYRPPRLNPVSMEGEEEKKRFALSRDDKRQMVEARRRASRSDALADLAAEVAGAPEEVRTALPGFDSMAALKMRHRLEARAGEEEDAFIRVPLSKDQAKALRATRRAGLSASALLGDFADEVSDLVGVTGADAKGGLAEVFARQKVSQRFGGEMAKPLSRAGDEDLPRRASLGERRAKFDSVAARRAAAADGSDDDMDGEGRQGGSKRMAGEEDDFYTAVKESAASRKKSRAEEHRAPDMAPPMADATTFGARPISREIQKNRGLTPHRRKDLKNPRKHQRIKFEKANVRRSGMVQEGGKNRDAGLTAYGGEATGVKSRVSKSRKL